MRSVLDVTRHVHLVSHRERGRTTLQPASEIVVNVRHSETAVTAQACPVISTQPGRAAINWEVTIGCFR